MLDIFGFENFKTNSFEQLLINITNEQLHHYFHQHIFAWEAAEYEREGVQNPGVSFPNNQEQIDLFLDKTGLLALINETSKFTKATDQKLLDKFHEFLVKYPHFRKTKAKSNSFIIVHYAAEVQPATSHVDKALCCSLGRLAGHVRRFRFLGQEPRSPPTISYNNDDE